MITKYEGLNNKANANALSTYPCQVVNFYSCPYENDKSDGDQVTITRENLFELNRIPEIIGRTFSKALTIKGNRIIYKIDFRFGKVQEIDIFLCGDPYAQDLPGGKPIEHNLEVLEKIEKLSDIPMNNLEDIFAILTDEVKLDTVLQIALDKKYLQHKDKLVEFFISIRSNVRIEDLVARTPVNYITEKNRCSVCNRPANLNCITCSGSGNDIWICMDHLKNHRDQYHNSIIS